MVRPKAVQLERSLFFAASSVRYPTYKLAGGSRRWARGIPALGNRGLTVATDGLTTQWLRSATCWVPLGCRKCGGTRLWSSHELNVSYRHKRLLGWRTGNQRSDKSTASQLGKRIPIRACTLRDSRLSHILCHWVPQPRPFHSWSWLDLPRKSACP